MVQYFIFKPAVNTHETGPQYPQIQKMVDGYNYNAPDSAHALSRSTTEFPSFKPNLDYFVVHNKAKLTDLLSVSIVHGGFLISERFKIIMERFQLAPHRFYEACVSHQNKFYKYYWIHIICDLSSYVDFPKSTFFIYKNYSQNIGYVNVSSLQDLKEKRIKIKSLNPGKTVTVWAEQIRFLNSFDKKLNLFTIGNYDSHYYISEDLHDSILQEKVTGCAMLPATNLIIP